MAKLFYFIRYVDSLKQGDAEQITSSVVCISKNQDLAKAKLSEIQKPTDYLFGISYSGVLPFETGDVPITSDRVWGVFKNDPKDPEFSLLRLIENSFEGCLNWWKENWKSQVYDCKGDTPQFEVVKDSEGNPTERHICRDERMFYDTVRIEPYDLS